MQPKYPGANCAKCPLIEQPMVNPWNIENGEILFIGEAPGIQEILEGVPFVGQSGMLLDKVIDRVGRDPLRIAKTNACLCRPHKTSDGTISPPLEALEACQGAMNAVLSSFSGSTVVTLGAVATQALDAFGDEDHSGGILSRRGVWHTAAIDLSDKVFFDWAENATSAEQEMKPIRVLKYLPTLHPAFVLRSPGYIQKLIDDIDKAYQGPDAKHPFLQTPYVIIEHFEMLKAMIVQLKNAPLVSFDIETEYLQWYDTPTKRGANVLCLVFAADTSMAYIVPDTTLTQPRVIEFLQMFFDSKAVLAHNGKFDVTVCKAKLGLDITLCDDTLLLHYTNNETKGGHGLKEIAQETFQIEDYEETILAPIFKEHKINRDNRNYGVLPRETLYKYAAIDAVVTLALYPILKERVEADDQLQTPYKDILMRASNALGIVELNGIPIDRPYLKKVHILVKRDVDNLQYNLRVLSLRPDLNPNSPQQVAKVLYDDLKLELHRQPIKSTSTNTGDECITILLEKYPDNGFVLMLKEFRRVEKIRSTYVSKLLEIADVHDRVHVNYLIHGTEVGRLSASDSLHGIPNPEDEHVPELKRYGAMIRGAFIAPKGYQLVMADYSQAEFRCFADETQEPFLLAAYNNGLDVHDETTKIMAPAMGKIYADMQPAEKKNLRRLAKNVNFGGLMYGGKPPMIAAQTGLARELVQTVMDHYFNHLSVARQWQKDQFRFAKRHGHVRNRFGFIRRFILQTSNNIDEIKKSCVHAVIACDASYLTILSVCEMIERGIPVVHTVHDSIIALVPDELVCNTEHHMQSIMERNGAKWFPSIPWNVDIEHSQSWYANRPNLEGIE